VPLLIAALLIQNALFRPSNEPGGGGLWMLLLLAALGIAGVVAEGTLPLDLFPVFRRREVRRLVYVVVAALFLTMLAQLWDHIFGGLALQVGRALAETPPDSADVASYFASYAPWELFLTHLISAGFEETIFRLGIMTLVWALTRRWWLGLLASALCFGLYHISPLSSIAVYNQQAPVTTVLQSFGAGLATGIIYRYRGFLAAVLIHALGNWLLLMLLAQTTP
jgi:membrane protease YdiL (CAAX protease family)